MERRDSTADPRRRLDLNMVRRQVILRANERVSGDPNNSSRSAIARGESQRSVSAAPGPAAPGLTTLGPAALCLTAPGLTTLGPAALCLTAPGPAAPIFGDPSSSEASSSSEDSTSSGASSDSEDTSDGVPVPPPANQEEIKELLRRLRRRHLMLAAAHSMASSRCSTFHQTLTILIILISLASIVIQEFLQVFASAVWAQLAGKLTLAIVGGLTGINNFLGFSAREQKHLMMRDEYSRTVDLIDIALAYSASDMGDQYDFITVVKEIQEIHDSLKRTAIQVPEGILKKFDDLHPWSEARDKNPSLFPIELQSV